MALIDCPGCGNKVSDRAKICPKCGISLKESVISKVEIKDNISTKKKKGSKFWFIMGLLIGGVIGFCSWFVIALIIPENNYANIEPKEIDLKETGRKIEKIENYIGEADSGDSEEIELFGLQGVVTYSNTLESFQDNTNTATWQPNTGSNTEKIYDNIVELYGEPVSTGGTYWTWNDQEELYRIVLQHGNLGINLVIQRESLTT